MLGMAIGDAIGAPLEFEPVDYNPPPEMRVTGMGIPGRLQGAFYLLPGQFTDDTSMGLCLADSLLARRGEFHPIDLMQRFCAWWYLGYNNAFCKAPNNQRRSVGLGGNISASFAHFLRGGYPYTPSGDRNTSGCGSLMRMAAVPVCFWRDRERAMEVCRLQSLTTHQGEEAAESCRLAASIICRAIQHDGPSGDATRHAVLDDPAAGFTTPEASVACLARSEGETLPPDSPWKPEDRNWNWKDPQYRYSPTRAARQPGYIGSYAMDNITMALHCVWTTTSFREAMLKAANMRGDADSVAAVAGQVAGAVYGARSIPPEWIRAVEEWDGGGEIALRGVLLHDLLGEGQA